MVMAVPLPVEWGEVEGCGASPGGTRLGTGPGGLWHFWPAGKAVATLRGRRSGPRVQPAAAHPLSAGKSCMRQTWSCSGNGNILRSWSHLLIAAVSRTQPPAKLGEP